jgi:HAD superfamily phosphoserine phosphatase-like hydrolase
MGFAFFDLDHTLLPHDTQALFCNYVLKRERWRTLLHLTFVPFALFRAAGLISTLRAKRAFMGYLWGMPEKRLQQYAQEFALNSARPWCYPEMLAIVEQHRSEGKKLILNTASPDFYGKWIAKELCFDLCYATKTYLKDRLEFHPSILTNNKHAAKIEAMYEDQPSIKALTESERRLSCVAYSDSKADLPLLRLGVNGFLVHPNVALEAVGQKEGWPVLRPKRPYCSKWGDMWAVIRQMMGMYPERPR